MSLSSAAVVYGSALMMLPLPIALLNTVGMGIAGAWIAPLALTAALAAGTFTLLSGRTTVTYPRSMVVLAGLPILLVSVASLVGRKSIETMVFGVSLEPGTVGSLLLFSIAIIFGSLVARASIPRILDIFLCSSAISSLMTLTYVYFSGWERIALMSNISLIMSAALIVAILRADRAREKSRIVYSAYALFFGAMSVLFFDPTAGFTAIFILLLSIGVSIWRRENRHVPWHFIFVVAALSAAFLLGSEGRYVPAAPDVRPSLSVTSGVAGAQYFQDARSAVLGVGPNSFHTSWEKYRVLELNATKLWQLTPRQGYSTAATFAITLGVLGFLSLVLIPLSFAVLVVLRFAGPRTEDDAALRDIAPPVVAITFFIFFSMFTEVLETPLFLAGGFMLGMAVRALESKEEIASLDVSFGGSRYAVGFFTIVSLALMVWLVQVSLRPMVAEGFRARAISLSATGDTSAPRLFERAARIWSAPQLALDASRAYVERARIADGLGDTFSSRVSIEKALAYAGRAIDLDPSNYEAWMYRSSLFVALIPSGYPNAVEKAFSDIENAKVRAPMRPDVLYQEALLELSRERKVNARIALEKALKLKSDYGEARILLDSLSE